MLLSFSVENFKSFKDPAELILTAKRSEKSIPGATVPRSLPGVDADGVLSAAAIYGSNASGKTNFLLALSFMRRAVSESQASWKPGTAIPLDPHVALADKPSKFEVQIHVSGIRYRYGFVANREIILEEWLYSYPTGRERHLFFRKTSTAPPDPVVSVDIGPNLRGHKRDINATSRRVRPNSLFLSAGAQDNQADCLEIYEWFSSQLRFTSLAVTSLSSSGTTMLVHEAPVFKELLISLLKLSDDSISNVTTKKTGDKNFEDVDLDKDSIRDYLSNYSAEFTLNDGNEEFQIDFEKESRGVKRMYSIAVQIITSLAHGATIVVDELETSMHAHVAAKLLALYQNRLSNPNSGQIIFSTHETRLMNLEHLRRDQIWFCEREGLSSKIYALTEFSPRKDDNFESGYLRGRYGAIPKASLDINWVENIKMFADDGYHARVED